jgi:hypothetical protein
MQTLNRKQAAKALGVSLRTLCNMMADGRVKYAKLENVRAFEQSVSFTYEQLGLPEPAPPAPAPAPAPLTLGLPVVEAAPEPYKEPVVLHRGANGKLVAMSKADAADQLRRDYNARRVADYRHRRLTNIKFDVLSGTPEHVARAQIDADCNELLKKMNRGIR